MYSKSAITQVRWSVWLSNHFFRWPLLLASEDVVKYWMHAPQLLSINSDILLANSIHITSKYVGYLTHCTPYCTATSWISLVLSAEQWRNVHRPAAVWIRLPTAGTELQTYFHARIFLCAAHQIFRSGRYVPDASLSFWHNARSPIWAAAFIFSQSVTTDVYFLKSCSHLITASIAFFVPVKYQCAPLSPLSANPRKIKLSLLSL